MLSDGYNEEKLLAKLKEGDESAFKLIFDRFYRPLTLFAMRYVGDIDEAKEVVQELFVRLWLKHNDLQIRFSLKMYLYQSTRNACLNYLEANKVVRGRMERYNPSVITNDDALDHLIAAEQEEILMQVIDRLPRKCREIFLLSRMEKLSNKAIADQLQISLKTVEAQMSIALKRLLEGIISLLFFFF